MFFLDCLERLKLKSYSMLMVHQALFISKEQGNVDSSLYDPLSGPAVRQMSF